MQRHELIKKIEELPPDRLEELESFVESLAHRDNQSDLYEALSDYAIKHAGTEADVDTDLEAASVEHSSQVN